MTLSLTEVHVEGPQLVEEEEEAQLEYSWTVEEEGVGPQGLMGPKLEGEEPLLEVTR